MNMFTFRMWFWMTLDKVFGGRRGFASFMTFMMGALFGAAVLHLLHKFVF